MARLLTIDDFIRVKKALESPDSEPHQYCIGSYGYCGFCAKITEYLFIESILLLRCRGCQHDFRPDPSGPDHMFAIRDNYGGVKVFRYSFDRNGILPAGSTIGDYEARDYNRKLFRIALDLRIERHEGLNSEDVRRLAELR